MGISCVGPVYLRVEVLLGGITNYRSKDLLIMPISGDAELVEEEITFLRKKSEGALE